MKTAIQTSILIIGVLLFTSFTADKADKAFPKVMNKSFETGEYLEYNITFGWFTVGEAYARVMDDKHRKRDRECYKVDMYGETSGFFKMISKVKDFWSSYLDTESLLPLYSYRDIKEGGHKKIDSVNYDHVNQKVEYQRINKHSGVYDEPTYFEARQSMFDLLGGLMYLRSYDYSKLEVGDSVSINAFYNKKFYDLKVVYLGKDRVKTKLGKINAIKLKPEIPNNKIFSGKNSIRFWLSDDENKLPLKFEVDMFIGDAGIEITKASGVKSKINYSN